MPLPLTSRLPAPASPDQAPWRPLIPAVAVGALCHAVAIGRMPYRTCLVIDRVVARVLMSNRMMLPPVTIARVARVPAPALHQLAATASCTTSSWPAFRAGIRAAGPVDQRRVALPDMLATMAVPRLSQAVHVGGRAVMPAPDGDGIDRAEAAAARAEAELQNACDAGKQGLGRAGGIDAMLARLPPEAATFGAPARAAAEVFSRSRDAVLAVTTPAPLLRR